MTRRIFAVIGFALLYLAAVNGTLAFNLGTCTQNSADELLGGIISLVLYLASTLCLIVTRPRRIVYFAALPPLLLMAGQFLFSVRFAYGYLIEGLSACAVLHDLGYEMDGREAFFVSLWLAMCAISFLGLTLAFYRGRFS